MTTKKMQPNKTLPRFLDYDADDDDGDGNVDVMLL